MGRGNFRQITDDEARSIELMLGSPAPRQRKAGLQRLCELYEAGKRYRNGRLPNVTVRGLLLSDAVVVRRWAFKAIAYIGTDEDAAAVLRALETEIDLENQTWAIAALAKLQSIPEVATLCRSAKLEPTIPFLLASRLFPNEFANGRTQAIKPPINIEKADALTLKWSSILMGYDHAPPHLFDPKHENLILLRKLNLHDATEVAEYSVWALHHRDEFSIEDLEIPLEGLSKQPENVRRWINRLVTKSPKFIERNMGLFVERSKDPDLAAREGLALGMRHICPDGIEARMLDWQSIEHERSISDLLLEYMAFHADHFPSYQEVVVEAFKRTQSDDGLRPRLLTASAQSKLRLELKHIEAKEFENDLSLLNDDRSPTISIERAVIIGKLEMDMSEKSTTFSAGRDITGQNLVGHDMINSANAAVQNMSNQAAEKETLLALLELLQSKDIADDNARAAAIAAVKDVAEEPTTEKKNTLLKILEGIGKGVSAASALAGQIGKIVATIGSWL